MQACAISLTTIVKMYNISCPTQQIATDRETRMLENFFWKWIFCCNCLLKKYGKQINESTLQTHHVYSTLKRGENERFWSIFRFVGFGINSNSFVPRLRSNQSYWYSTLADNVKSQHLLVQSQQWKHHKNVWNLLKVNNEGVVQMW